MDDFADPRCRHPDLQRQCVLRNAEWDKELFSQHFAWMRADSLNVPSGSWSGDRHICRPLPSS
jgi:hypothetical protein